MKTILFIIISLVSGIIAGEIFATINLFVVELTDKAIGYELHRDIAKKKAFNFTEFHSYRVWQKSGTFAAIPILGTALLLGIDVFRILFSSL